MSAQAVEAAEKHRLLAERVQNLENEMRALRNLVQEYPHPIPDVQERLLMVLDAND